MKSNIVLIGMPGAGKSTVGPALAARLGKRFLDTDEVVAEMAGMALKDYAAQYGRQSFQELQENALLCLMLSDHVIATGGSVGCSPVLMEHLKKDGYVVYLKVAYSIVEQRLAPGRTLARDGGTTLEELYRQREPLYEAFSDMVADCSGQSVERIVDAIVHSAAHSTEQTR